MSSSYSKSRAEGKRERVWEPRHTPSSPSSKCFPVGGTPNPDPAGGASGRSQRHLECPGISSVAGALEAQRGAVTCPESHTAAWVTARIKVPEPAAIRPGAPSTLPD